MLPTPRRAPAVGVRVASTKVDDQRQPDRHPERPAVDAHERAPDHQHLGADQQSADGCAEQPQHEPSSVDRHHARPAERRASRPPISGTMIGIDRLGTEIRWNKKLAANSPTIQGTGSLVRLGIRSAPAGRRADDQQVGALVESGSEGSRRLQPCLPRAHRDDQQAVGFASNPTQHGVGQRRRHDLHLVAAIGDPTLPARALDHARSRPWRSELGPDSVGDRVPARQGSGATRRRRRSRCSRAPD